MVLVTALSLTLTLATLLTLTTTTSSPPPSSASASSLLNKLPPFLDPSSAPPSSHTLPPLWPPIPLPRPPLLHPWPPRFTLALSPSGFNTSSLSPEWEATSPCSIPSLLGLPADSPDSAAASRTVEERKDGKAAARVFRGLSLREPEYFRPSEYRFFTVSATLSPGSCPEHGKIARFDAVVKVFDGPNPAAAPETPSNSKSCHARAHGYSPYVPYVDAISRVEVECGLDALTPQSFIGYFELEDGEGSWACAGFVERLPEDTVSLDVLSRESNPEVVREAAVAAALVKPWQVALITLRDVLLGYRDRHPGNVFIGSDTLDLYNLDGFQVSLAQHYWRRMSVDSFFLPMSEKHAIASFGWIYQKGGRPAHTGPLARGRSMLRSLDLRCKTSETSASESASRREPMPFPPRMGACLARIAHMDSIRDVQAAFGFGAERESEMLQDNARSLLKNGLEAHVVATAVREQRGAFETLFGRDSAWRDAVAASGSLPAALTPVNVQRHVLWYASLPPCCADRSALAKDPACVSSPSIPSWNWTGVYAPDLGDEVDILYAGGAYEFGPIPPD